VLLGHRRRLLRAIAELDGAPAAAIMASSAPLGVKPALRYARWRGQRTLYACTIPKLEKLEGDALDQQPWTLSAKVILFGAA
jgi:hypothetical protein